MNLHRKKNGFTLLEIIIVIIIVGVLASLALPRFFAIIEYSRSTEALTAIGVVRQSIERCYLQLDGTYTGCNDFTDLDIEDPAGFPNAHFGYALSGQSITGYIITATRNTVDGGVVTSSIIVTQTATAVTKSGTTAFEGIPN